MIRPILSAVLLLALCAGCDADLQTKLPNPHLTDLLRPGKPAGRLSGRTPPDENPKSAMQNVPFNELASAMKNEKECHLKQYEGRYVAWKLSGGKVSEGGSYYIFDDYGFALAVFPRDWSDCKCVAEIDAADEYEVRGQLSSVRSWTYPRDSVIVHADTITKVSPTLAGDNLHSVLVEK